MRTFVAALLVVVASLPTGAAAEERLSVDQLKDLALRSPNVFDTFFEQQGFAEQRLPHAYVRFELVVGPAFEINVDGTPTLAQLAGGKLSAGGVVWTWAENAGLRIGLDGFSTNLTPKGQAMEDGWGYRSSLLFASAFDETAGWSLSLGLFLRARPAITTLDGQKVFTVPATDRSSVSSGNFEYTSESGGKTTVTSRTAGFVHGTIPFINLTTGFLFDSKGIRSFKGAMDVLALDLWESVGPLFVVLPQLDNYQLGAHATGFRMWDFPLALSSEATARYEKGEGVAFDHALLRIELTLFEDKPDRGQNWRNRKEFARDFHLRLSAFGSYFNMPRADTDWGWGFELEALSFGFGIVEFNVGVGGGYNYYQDILMLPVAGAANFRFHLGAAL